MLDEPVNLPDGTEVSLLPADQHDDLDEDDRSHLHAAISRAHEQRGRGEGVSAEHLLADLDREDLG